MRPPPGSPKKRENSPKKKIVSKEALSKVNKMDLVDLGREHMDGNKELEDNVNSEPEELPLI